MNRLTKRKTILDHSSLKKLNSIK